MLTKVAPGGNLESLARRGPAGPTTESVPEGLASGRFAGGILDHRVTRESHGQSEEVEESALRKLSKGDFDDLSPREELRLEAIVEERGRPVSFIIEGKFQDLPAPWVHYNDATLPIRRRIEGAIPSIGRVEAPSPFPGEAPDHLGTGFIVGRNLMMTNRHVAELFVRGVGQNRSRLTFVPGIAAAIDFRREKGFSPSDRSASAALVDVIMVHPYWDMALFRVEGLPSEIGVLPLSVCAPEDLGDREIAVIGYPARSRDRSPKAVDLEKKHFGTIFGVKRIAPGEIRSRERVESFNHFVPAMTHDSSTLPGNSGSAILDVHTGEIVGLHFAGITLKANYSVPTFELARDRRVVDCGLRFEGRLPPPTNEWSQFWKVAESELDGVSVAPTTMIANNPFVPIQQGATATWTIPLTVAVSLGCTNSTATAAPAVATNRSSQLLEASFQIPIIHPDLEHRAGYDRMFLELDDGGEVPLPQLTSDGEGIVSRLADGTFELKYHRFSVVMHKKRRLALFTAANVNWQRNDRLVDGHKPTREELTGIPDGVLEEWVMDPRIPEEEQLSDLFFTKDGGAFDKGHLVRRDDVAWGSSFEEMQKGNGDTYHTTNCSPQVSKFNRSAQTDNWGDLENMIQKQTSAEKVIIFSGPVLSAQDRIFKGVDESGLVKVRIPRKFWKIVVAKTDDGPRAFGFILKQKLSGVPLEFTIPEDWEPHQTPIPEIEESLFGLVSLDWCKSRDALST